MYSEQIRLHFKPLWKIRPKFNQNNWEEDICKKIFAVTKLLNFEAAVELIH